MDLRDLTREAEQARPLTTRDDFRAGADALATEQMDLVDRTEIVIEDIEYLPNGAQEFAREIGKLKNALAAMREAEEELLVPSTGPVTIAAETAAIEYLLEARRVRGGGGGGGSTPGSGGPRKGRTDVSALALAGRSEDEKGQVQERDVEAVAGRSGPEIPEELRAGLDRFFERLNAE